MVTLSRPPRDVPQLELSHAPGRHKAARCPHAWQCKVMNSIERFPAEGGRKTGVCHAGQDVEEDRDPIDEDQ